MAGFAVAVKLVDLATGPLATINKAIGSLDVTAKKVAREGGLFEARDALKGIREQAKEVGESLTTAFRPLEGLIGGVAAGGLIGGLALMAQRFASVGTEIGRTSSSLGLNTATLQHWRGVAELAGGSAEEVTSSLANVATGLYHMKAGLNPVAFREVQRWGLDVNKGASYAERGANLMLQVSDLITKNPLLKDNPQAQRNLLGNLGIDERMLPLLQKGREALQDYFKEAERHGYLTDAQILKSEALKRAYVGLEQSVSSTALAIGGQIGTWLTPMLVKWSEWLDKARETPAIMKTIELGAEGLAVVFGVTMVSALARLTVAINSVWALPLFRFLVANPWIAGLIAGGWAFAPKSLNEGEAADIRAHPELYPQMPGGPQGLLAPHGAASQNLAANNPGNLKAATGGWQTFESPEAGIRGVGDWLSRWAARGKRTISDLVSTYSPPSENDTPALIARAAGRLGVDPNAPIDVEDPKIKRALVQAFLRNEWGGTLPRGYTDEQIAAALGGPRKSNVGSLQNSFLPPATAPQGGPTDQRSYLDRLFDELGIRTPGAAPAAGAGLTLPDVNGMAPRIPTAAEPAQGAAGPQSNLDSSHKVEVSFLNAPTGMRAGMTQSQGPAEVSVRTHYSLDNLS